MSGWAVAATQTGLPAYAGIRRRLDGKGLVFGNTVGIPAYAGMTVLCAARIPACAGMTVGVGRE